MVPVVLENDEQTNICVVNIFFLWNIVYQVSYFTSENELQESDGLTNPQVMAT